MEAPGRLRLALRDATREQHEELDRSLDLGTDLTEGRYIAFLQASFAALALLEREVARWIPSVVSPSRCELLRTDLASLDVVPSEPRPPSFVPRDRAEAIGSAYVLEGSALGGQVLAKSVAAQLGDRGAAATRYLQLRGADTGRAWKAFVTLLDEADAQMIDAERHACCAAATATFAHYRAAFRTVAA